MVISFVGFIFSLVWNGPNETEWRLQWAHWLNLSDLAIFHQHRVGYGMSNKAVLNESWRQCLVIKYLENYLVLISYSKFNRTRLIFTFISQPHAEQMSLFISSLPITPSSNLGLWADPLTFRS